MIQNEQSKRLKAFAKKREARVPQVMVRTVGGDRERIRTECLGKLTAAILATRSSDPKLRDATVVEALRYACREPGAHVSSRNRVHLAMESIRSENMYETSTWRSAIRSILELVDATAARNRNSTQLLDLLDTVVH